MAATQGLYATEHWWELGTRICSIKQHIAGDLEWLLKSFQLQTSLNQVFLRIEHVLADVASKKYNVVYQFSCF